VTDEQGEEARLKAEAKVDARRTETVVEGTPTALVERISSPVLHAARKSGWTSRMRLAAHVLLAILLQGR
jgi:hypothetical protein